MRDVEAKLAQKPLKNSCIIRDDLMVFYATFTKVLDLIKAHMYSYKHFSKKYIQHRYRIDLR